MSSPDLINTADLAELLGMKRSASWHAAEVLQAHAPEFRRATNCPMEYERDPQGRWTVNADHGQKFAGWWVERQAGKGLKPRWVAICTEAFLDFKRELEELGAGDALDIIGITEPFFDRIEPDNEKWKKAKAGSGKPSVPPVPPASED